MHVLSMPKFSTHVRCQELFTWWYMYLQHVSDCSLVCQTHMLSLKPGQLWMHFIKTCYWVSTHDHATRSSWTHSQQPSLLSNDEHTLYFWKKIGLHINSSFYTGSYSRHRKTYTNDCNHHGAWRICSGCWTYHALACPATEQLRFVASMAPTLEILRSTTMTGRDL